MARPGGNGAARGIDVKLNVLLRIFAGEKEHLGNDEIGYLVVDRRAEEDDVVAKQTGINVVGALAPARLLNHHGNQCHFVSSSRSSGYGTRFRPIPWQSALPESTSAGMRGNAAGLPSGRQSFVQQTGGFLSFQLFTDSSQPAVLRQSHFQGIDRFA